MPSVCILHPPAQPGKPVLWTCWPQETNSHHALTLCVFVCVCAQPFTHKLMCREGIY